jgi:hypothetical protein
MTLHVRSVVGSNIPLTPVNMNFRFSVTSETYHSTSISTEVSHLTPALAVSVRWLIVVRLHRGVPVLGVGGEQISGVVESLFLILLI